MNEVEVGLNDQIMLQKGDTIVAGVVDGIKLNRGEMEKISIEHLGFFDFAEGWMAVRQVEEEDA
jgi:ABC-type uncharacterized transport system ATPase subunit